jgi:hypothetical protein
MRNTILIFFYSSFLSFSLLAQSAQIEGSIFDQQNNPIQEVAVEVFDIKTNKLIVNTLTNQKGIFTAQVPSGKKYHIIAKKEAYHLQQTKLHVKKKDKNKKVFVNLKMNASKKSISNQNTSIDNPYTEVTNATRLAAGNYQDASDRENRKHQKIPSAYQQPLVIDVAFEKKQALIRQNRPKAYAQTPGALKIVPAQLGEDMVLAGAATSPAKPIPSNYTGYKIQFVTSFDLLTEYHKIFSQHGNIFFDKKGNGLYCYLLGNFQNKKQAELFLKEVMHFRYPSAEVIYFNNGLRTNFSPTVTKTNKPLSKPPQ